VSWETLDTPRLRKSSALNIYSRVCPRVLQPNSLLGSEGATIFFFFLVHKNVFGIGNPKINYDWSSLGYYSLIPTEMSDNLGPPLFILKGGVVFWIDNEVLV